jgi:hypothetical protein
MLALVYGVLPVDLSALVGFVRGMHSLRPYGMPLLIRENDSVGAGFPGWAESLLLDVLALLSTTVCQVTMSARAGQTNKYENQSQIDPPKPIRVQNFGLGLTRIFAYLHWWLVGRYRDVKKQIPVAGPVQAPPNQLNGYSLPHLSLLRCLFPALLYTAVRRAMFPSRLIGTHHNIWCCSEILTVPPLKHLLHFN